MNLLHTLRDKFSSKKPCYECGRPTAAAHLHTVQYNFHGNLSHHEICDDCYRKVKGQAPPKKK